MNQAFAALGSFILRQVIKQEFLRGYRMYFAGASSILAGIILGLDLLAGGTYTDERAGAALAAIMFGYKIIGQAGKQDALITNSARSATAAVSTPPMSRKDVATVAAIAQATDEETGHV